MENKEEKKYKYKVISMVIMPYYCEKGRIYNRAILQYSLGSNTEIETRVFYEKSMDPKDFYILSSAQRGDKFNFLEQDSGLIELTCITQAL